MGGGIRTIIAGLAACLFGLAGPAWAAGCRFEPIDGGQVGSVTDGRTFLLTDNRPIRLPAIEVPVVENGGRGTAGVAARDALIGLILRQNLQLRRPAGVGGLDRYGRTIADAVVTVAGTEQSVTHAMLAQGHARVGTHPEPGCIGELLALERSARDAKLGLWGEPYYQLRGANDGAALLAERGQFTLVEGKVVSVRESGGTLYMNFGRRWSEALTVTILKRHERTFMAAGLTPKQLENRVVRVRGWIEERNGPRIEAARPEQIEIAERN
jgi:endonuclease YncB( thermonuclease family)